jgi:hypothetical protein
VASVSASALVSESVWVLESGLVSAPVLESASAPVLE